MNVLNNLLQPIIDFLKKLRGWVIIAPWEQGLRVRLGKHTKLLKSGFHFKLPLADIVHVQNTRLRFYTVPTQTICTKDRKTVTIGSIVGFSIQDIEILYKNIHSPEEVVCSKTQGIFAELIGQTTSETFSVIIIEETALDYLQSMTWGLKIESVKITDVAFVRTYRIINDSRWGSERMDMINSVK